jgi:phage shock protein A
MSPLTTHPPSYASAVTRNLQQQPRDEANQIQQQLEELKTMMTAMMQRISEIESATTTSTGIAQQPSPARIRKKNKSSTDQGGTSMDMDALEVEHNNHESS